MEQAIFCNFQHGSLLYSNVEPDRLIVPENELKKKQRTAAALSALPRPATGLPVYHEIL
jgi:hypothetical protein